MVVKLFSSRKVKDGHLNCASTAAGLARRHLNVSHLAGLCLDGLNEYERLLFRKQGCGDARRGSDHGAFFVFVRCQINCQQQQQPQRHEPYLPLCSGCKLAVEEAWGSVCLKPMLLLHAALAMKPCCYV